MPTPDGIQTVVLHGKFVEPDDEGTPISGTLTFTPNPSVITFPEQNVIVTNTETATLDSNGEFTIELICTDTLGQNPTNWLYTVVEKLIGTRQRTYNIALPYTMQVMELADLTPTEAEPQYIPVVGPQGAPGLVTSVNGYSQPTINLVVEDIPGAVNDNLLGAPLGVATLDAGAQLTLSQLPDISGDYVAWNQVGVAGGVAGLTISGYVPPAQLDMATSAPPSVGTGATGTSAQLAKADHTHDGVDLTSAQAIAGIKRFTSSVGVGVADGLLGKLDVIHAEAALPAIHAENTNGASTAPVIEAEGGHSSATLLAGRLTSDTNYRISLRASGSMVWGDGTNSPDLTFYRSAAGILNSSGQLASDAPAPLAASHLTRKDYVDGPQTITGLKLYSGAAVSTDVIHTKVAAEPGSRFALRASGQMLWTDGTNVADVDLYRDGAGVLATSGIFRSYRSAPAGNAFSARVTGDANSRWYVNADGANWWGAGTAVADTNLYRSAANALKTDDSFESANLIQTMGWTSVNSIASLAAGVTADTDVPPRMRKYILFGTEVWEFEGRYNFTGFTFGSTHIETAFTLNTGYRVTKERSFFVGSGPAGNTAIRITFQISGSVQIGRLVDGSTYFRLDGLRITNPLI